MSKPLIIQADDDLDLLHLMVEDARRADPLYQPTNYWATYEKRFLPELVQQGLSNFRRREQSVLRSFGGSTRGRRPPLDYYGMRWLPRTVHHALQEALYRSRYYQAKRQKILRWYAEQAAAFGRECGARPLSDISLPLVGNPHQLIECEGRYYDLGLINYYILYAWTCRVVDYATVNVYAELGAGLGTQAVLLKQLYPKMTVLLFDLPTQLYVCEQYLQSVFPGQVVSYRTTRRAFSLGDCLPGQIYILGAFQFPLLENSRVDLFWNAASFQEMEPDVVANYLNFVRHARWIVLRAAMYGKRQASIRGEPGVLKRTTYVDYVGNLAPTHELLAMDRSRHYEQDDLDKDCYNDSVWEKRVVPLFPRGALPVHEQKE